MSAKKRLAVFISGGGTNLQVLIDGVLSQKINAEIVLTVSSNADAYGLERAKKAGIPTFVAPIKSYASSVERDKAILAKLRECGAELIFLCGYLGIVTSVLVSAYSGKMVNIHPALLPKHGGQGMYGIMPHREVLRLNERITGATTHFVDEGTDTGAIILQKSLEVQQDETAEQLQERVLINCEHPILMQTAVLLCSDKIALVNGKAVISD